ncbi:MAG: plastocyanin/azurin family copper-binding protein, partial [Nitrososphaerales archaeon]
AISAHMFYGFALYIISTPVYPLYPVDQQALLGVFLFAPSPVYFVGFLYITLTRESRKLDAEKRPDMTAVRRPMRKRLGHLTVAALSILMIVALSGYFAMTVVAIDSSPSQSLVNVPVVYIVETPILWQYSPQNITVVMGLNNTVEWISHSLAYDTVTSTTGSFSHSFSPGGTFEYTFPAQGVYDYYCTYHPWMKGTVVVLPSGTA